MSAISTAVTACIEQFKTKTIHECGSTALRVIVTEAAKKQLEGYIGFVAGPTITILITSMPYLIEGSKLLSEYCLAGNVSKIALKELFELKKISALKPEVLISLFTLAMQSGTKDTWCDQGMAMATTAGLDYLCTKVGKKAGSYSGNILYAVTVEKIAPNANPLSLPMAKCILYVGSYITSFIYHPNQTDKTEYIPTKDFDDFVVVKPKKKKILEDDFEVID